MSDSPSPKQTLILWYLLAHGGHSWLKDINLKVAKGDRDRLVKSGLIDVVGRRDENTRRNAMWIEVTEAGWAWANEHLASELPKSPLSGLLQAWLTRLHTFMRCQGVPLVEIILPSALPDVGDLNGRIEAAYLSVSGGAWNKRVRLSELRKMLSDVSRDQLDMALVNLQRDARIALFALDNRRELTPADRQAAIKVGGEMAHTVYMGLG